MTLIASMVLIAPIALIALIISTLHLCQAYLTLTN